MRLITAGILGLALLACSGEDGVTNPQNDVVSVEMTTPPSSLLVGETYQISAVPRNAAGGAPDNAPITWRSSNEAIATVLQGAVKAVSTGSVQIFADAGGKTGVANVEVVQTAMILSPDRYDGGTLGFTSSRVGGALDLFAVGPGGLQRITSNKDHEQFDGWSPDGSRIALIRFPVESPTFSSRVVNADGTNDVLVAAGIVNWAPDWQHRGSVFNGRVVITRPDGSEPRILGPAAAGYSVLGPWWSTDGTRVAFAYAASETSAYDIYVSSIDGTGLRNITNTLATSEEFASWSPDGSRLAITGRNPGASIGNSISVVNADGTGMTQITSQTVPQGDYEPQWSPDGKLLSYTTELSTSIIMQLVRVQGGPPVRLTPLTMLAGFPAWSKDGTRLAFTGVAANSVRQDVFVMTIDRKQIIQLTRGTLDNLNPFWKP